jgi:hypothetical protein
LAKRTLPPGAIARTASPRFSTIASSRPSARRSSVCSRALSSPRAARRARSCASATSPGPNGSSDVIRRNDNAPSVRPRATSGNTRALRYADLRVNAKCSSDVVYSRSAASLISERSCGSPVRIAIAVGCVESGSSGNRSRTSCSARASDGSAAVTTAPRSEPSTSSRSMIASSAWSGTASSAIRDNMVSGSSDDPNNSPDRASSSVRAPAATAASRWPARALAARTSANATAASSVTAMIVSACPPVTRSATTTASSSTIASPSARVDAGVVEGPAGGASRGATGGAQAYARPGGAAKRGAARMVAL